MDTNRTKNTLHASSSADDVRRAAPISVVVLPSHCCMQVKKLAGRVGQLCYEQSQLRLSVLSA
jgi:hypothetical protein